MNDDITILADFDSALYEQVEPPLVSLYLPTHGSAPGDESDRIEFEALVEQARATELLEKFGDAEAHGGASSDLEAIGLALAERKVRALFLAEGAYIPGGFDEQTGEVFLFEREPHGRFQGPELADGFVRAALAQDADVFELPAETIPGDSGIAALYRY